MKQNMKHIDCFKKNTDSLVVYFDLCPTLIKDCHTLHCTEL